MRAKSQQIGVTPSSSYALRTFMKAESSTVTFLELELHVQLRIFGHELDEPLEHSWDEAGRDVR